MSCCIVILPNRETAKVEKSQFIPHQKLRKSLPPPRESRYLLSSDRHLKRTTSKFRSRYLFRFHLETCGQKFGFELTFRQPFLERATINPDAQVAGGKIPMSRPT